jgi:CBS domain-containing protein
MMITVRHLLEGKGKEIWSVTPDTSVLDALRLMDAKGIGAVVVMEDDRLVGIMSERDYARKVILRGKNSKDTTVREIMTQKVFTVHPDQTIDECMDQMTDRSIRHLPVVLDDRVIGVISIKDVLRAIVYRQREMLKQTEPRSYGP